MSKKFTAGGSIFADETVLYEDYMPESLPEREVELDRIHEALEPITRGAAPHNTFVYGKTGQGKTVAVEHKLRQLEEFASTQDDLNLTTIHYNCAQDTSTYQVAVNLVDDLTGDRPWGHDKRTVFQSLYEALQDIGGTVIIVLDEIDSIGTDDDILYELPRARKNGHIEDMWVRVIGISNDFDFRDNLSPKVKDTLCDEEIHFPPYDANQLTPILRRRAKKAFQTEGKNTLSDDVIPHCAALAAQDRGSARQAIRYLYKAGEIASSRDQDIVRREHVVEAEEILERKSIEKGIRDLTTQDHLALASVVQLEKDGETPARTRVVYAQYKDIANNAGANQIAMRRVRDHLQELEMVGVLQSHGRQTGVRGGPHYVWELDADLGVTLEVIKEIDRIADAMGLADFG